MIVCPVCKRPAGIGEDTDRVFRHRDGINRLCVMTGRKYPQEHARGEAA